MAFDTQYSCRIYYWWYESRIFDGNPLFVKPEQFDAGKTQLIAFPEL
jgi:hypothetical protein